MGIVTVHVFTVIEIIFIDKEIIEPGRTFGVI